MKKEYDPDAYGIIGLGRFGLSLALELTKAGKQVIVLEIEEEKLNAVKDQLENIYPVKAVTEEVLHESGISHCRTAIVCIGKDIESNILVTMSLIELGIPRETKDRANRSPISTSGKTASAPICSSTFP